MKKFLWYLYWGRSITGFISATTMGNYPSYSSYHCIWNHLSSYQMRKIAHHHLTFLKRTHSSHLIQSTLDLQRRSKSDRVLNLLEISLQDMATKSTHFHMALLNSVPSPQSSFKSSPEQTLFHWTRCREVT